jgi:hypothetical protein
MAKVNTSVKQEKDMSRHLSATVMLAGMVTALTAPVAALAQEGNQNRFRLEKTESGFVRLDTETGALTLCRDEGGALTCRMAADERAAYEKELDLLEKRVTALENRQGTAATKSGPPSEDEIETSRSWSVSCAVSSASCRNSRRKNGNRRRRTAPDLCQV